MFTKRTEKEGTGGGAGHGHHAKACCRRGGSRQQTAAARARQARPPSWGAELSIKGNLESRGEVQIDGAIEGDVHAMRIVVGEAAHITGNLLAEDVVVRGAVAGSIRGKKVTLEAASHVEGDIFHRMLAIERGAFLKADRAEWRIPPPCRAQARPPRQQG